MLMRALLTHAQGERHPSPNTRHESHTSRHFTTTRKRRIYARQLGCVVSISHGAHPLAVHVDADLNLRIEKHVGELHN